LAGISGNIPDTEDSLKRKAFGVPEVIDLTDSERDEKRPGP
jgi:hypothetical protein